jgi:alpha-L-arabinofuranosidase
MSAKCFVKILLIEVLVILGWGKVFADTPDSALLAVENRNGLYFKWSVDGEQWHTINHCFLTSDYGPWGSHKKMHDPVLTREDGRWKCVFRADENVYGRTVSPDLIHWKPQDYYIDRDAKKDLSSYTDTFEVDWQTIDNLMKTAQLSAYKRLLYDEQAKDDAVRFAGLQPVKATMTVDTGKPKKISDKLIGVFFEDINYAADGGLYAELLQNRDFEYSPKDRREWNSTTAWTIDTRHSPHEIKIDTLNPLHPNNPHHVVLESGQTLVNEGFDGIAIKQGDKYDFSMFAKAEKPGRIAVKLIDDKENAASNEVSIKIGAENWKKYEAVLTARQTATNAKLQVAVSPLPDNVIGGAGWEVRCDLFSLFPQKTFKDRKNGLRADLAQAIADLKPRFVRFPGGCLAHGNGIENIYRWKESIGKLEERKPDFNIWGYHQTKGLGYFEYFQFCEDIGAEPLPILAAGVPCQNSRKGKNGLAGQQGGIPLEEMEAYIQDILDLIEWANGDKSTTWGKLRAQAGHPEPFNLKYIGIGNEDLISEVFKERFEMIFKAIEEKHPEITVVGTTGPFYEGSDYDEGWRFATELGVPMVDEHYYVSPAWMIYNADFYDKYDRKKPKVYLGEYAAHLPGRPNNLETALAEALHLCNVERNADIVLMTSYAPLLAKEGHTQWNPDLIYFNNTEVKPTVGYWVQKLFGNNAGEEYIPATVEMATDNAKARARFAHSIVRDIKTGDYIVKLVNLLPVETAVEFHDFDFGDAPVEKTVLTGDPADKTAKPTTVKEKIQNNNVVLPAYSFTVLRKRPTSKRLPISVILTKG